MKNPIYLDHHATTPCDPRVQKKMLPFFSDQFGNAASQTHEFGRYAGRAVESARQQVAQLIGASAREIVFTSGATESNNLAILGIARAYKDKGNHILTAATEHKSVLYSCRALEKEGFNLTVLPVDRFGCLDPSIVEKAITDQTILVTLMQANNEIGTLHPLKEIGTITKKRGIVFHSDAVQGAGKVPIDVEEMGIDLLSISGHKIYGPKGIGALYIRQATPRLRLSPISFGAGQEKGLRSGTLNVPGIVGLGEACAIAAEEMKVEIQNLQKLRNRLRDGLQSKLSGIQVNGHPTERLPNNLHVSFEGIPGNRLMESLSDLAVSSGAACTSTSVEASHVMKAIGVTDEMAAASIRFAVGRFNSEEEMDRAVEIIVSAIRHLRESLGSHLRAGPDMK